MNKFQNLKDKNASKGEWDITRTGFETISFLFTPSSTHVNSILTQKLLKLEGIDKKYIYYCDWMWFYSVLICG